MTSIESRLTFVYKVTANGTLVKLDLYPPLISAIHNDEGNNKALNSAPKDVPIVPAVIYFHGGGLTVGDRQSWFPTWLHRRITARGISFISADYRLLPPSNGHHIVEDIKDLFKYLQNELNSSLDSHFALEGASNLGKFHVDSNAIAVAGSSAGGFCSYLAAMHASPKPKVVVSLYGEGGQFFSPHYLKTKYKPFLRGREILDPQDFSAYMHPFPQPLDEVSGSTLAYHPQSYPIPGFPANPRMLVTRLYLQLGIAIDYIIGQHEPSLSPALRDALDEDFNDASDQERLSKLIPERHIPLFPQLGVTQEWPPTFLIHGAEDSAVLVEESYHLDKLLRHAGVPVKLAILEGEEHSFDYEPNAESKYGTTLFDEVADYLQEHLKE